MVRIGEIELVAEPADDQSPDRIDCYRVTERSASGAVFKLDRLFYSLQWQHNAQSPDFELVLVQDGAQAWVNTANLTLFAELRRRAPHAIDWARMQDLVPVLDAFETGR